MGSPLPRLPAVDARQRSSAYVLTVGSGGFRR